MDSDRPAFKRLIQDARAGYFQTIICKTQARFTRDMELVEKYIHGLFPILGIRFIGVVDNVDTSIRGNKKARQINGLINEWYCEDLSENIRSVFKTKMEKGQFLGAYASYGYMKDPKDNHRLLIDEEAAEVVRKIFSWALNGMGRTRICDKLYEEKILTPSQYKKKQGLSYENPNSELMYGKVGIWGTTTIHNILTNRIYVGDMIQGKQRKVSYKSKRVIHVPKSEWIIVPSCHEPIIDKETFMLVQDVREHRRYNRSVCEKDVRNVHLLVGKVKCRDCGSTLTISNGRTKYALLTCQLYKRSKKEQCTLHSISYHKLVAMLEERIRALIQEHIQYNNMEEYLFYEQDHNKTLQNKKAELSKIESKIQSIENAITMLYIDKANQTISEDEYNKLKESLNQQIVILSDKSKDLKESVKSLARDNMKYERKDDLIRRYADFEALDFEIINEFIDYIEIGEKDNEKNQEIVIHWRF
jgi:DNA invertase Pin-like site-specific DNA recombinase/ssDNA-binding Zn-finger/Zn-ribbon topoisomerase 1